MKHLALALAATLLSCKVVLPYPGNYGPFAPDDELETFPIHGCETTEQKDEISVATDFSSSCGNDSQWVDVLWNPVTDRFALEITDGDGAILIPQTEIEGVLAGSMDLNHADLNGDSSEDYVAVTWSGGVGLALSIVSLRSPVIG